MRTNLPISATRVRSSVLWLAVVLGLGVLLGGAAAQPVWGQSPGRERALELLNKRYADRYAEYAAEMEQLAKYCEEQSYFSDAEEIRQRARPVSEGTMDIDDLPETLLPEIPRTLPPTELQWRTKLRKIETDYANELFRIARDALSQGHVSLAFALVRETAFHNPDHAPSREMLGYVRDGEEWTTAFARMMKKKNYVDDPTFGWIDRKLLPRYLAGERELNGQWVSAEREAAIRSDFRYAWQIQTEHFEVRTNHSREKGVEIARQLEEFHAFFLREFTAFFNSREQLQRLFTGRPGGRNVNHRYYVYYFRNKEEFVRALRPRQPNIDQINGLYMPADRIAYFYFDEKSGDETLETVFHEVTHQLLGESRNRMFDVGEKSDFWVIEGLACYLESYDLPPRGEHVGHPRHLRIYWARRKAIDEGFYVPMREFTGLGKQQFQQPGNYETLQAYYNQAAGVVHFFLNYQDGIYQDAFIEYLSQVYHPSDRVRNNPDTLEDLTGIRFETLDQQYLEHLESLPAGLPVGRVGENRE